MNPDVDFSAMTPIPVTLNSFVQMTKIEVNETGSQAAAATEIGFLGSVAVGPTAPIESFVADRPFVFILRDASGMDLFMGVVNDPSAQ